MPKTTARSHGTSRRRLTPSVRRALIDEAATKVFAEHGYEAATMQEIARAAGVVASVIYDYYPSKRELYVELLEQHGRVLIERSIRTPTNPDLRAELYRQIDDFFRTIEEDPFVWRMLFRDPPGDVEMAATHARVQAVATGTIAAVLKTGVIDVRPKAGVSESVTAVMIAEMVKSSLNGLATWWWEHREIHREDLVSTATALLWDGLSQNLSEAMDH